MMSTAKQEAILTELEKSIQDIAETIPAQLRAPGTAAETRNLAEALEILIDAYAALDALDALGAK